MPIFAAAMNLMDDPIQWVMRALGRKTGVEPVDYTGASDLVNALRDPATEAAAVSRMHKLHYGAFYNKTSRNGISWMAERELLKKGKGWGGAVFGRPVKGLSIGISHLKSVGPWVPLTAFGSAYMAPKGSKLSHFVGGAASVIGFGVGDLIGTALAGPLAGFALGLLGDKAGNAIGTGLQDFSQIARQRRVVDMGGKYEDTQLAFTMRQRAAQEMGSSVMNARRYLGSEALLMHQ
jgi:hypothetical protein